MDMKKGLLVLVLLVAFGFQSIAQVLIGKDASENLNCTVNESFENLEISQRFSFLELERIRESNSEFYKLNMGDNFVHSLKLGEADLPTYTFFVEIPFCEDIVIDEKVEGKRVFSLGNDVKVYPKQPSQSKQNEELVFQMDKRYYSTNSFGNENRVSIEVLGVMNGVRLAKISVSPLRYNPYLNQIEFVETLNYTVRFVNPDYPRTLSLRKKTNSNFSNFISSKVMNPKNVSASVSASPVTSPYKMIIVSDRRFEVALQPFVEWKTRQGFEILIAYTDEIGSSTQNIKSYLQLLWDNASENNPAADYLLLCGDVSQIPTFDGEHAGYGEEHPTDLYYAEYTNDILPDIFYGRFSATSVSQMQAIVDKTINYEAYLFEDDSYLDKILLVAGKETNSPAPTCVNGQMNYVKQYFPDKDTSVYYNPASGSYSSQIKSKINSGQGWINYSAHCDESGWYSPSYLSSNVSSATNVGKYGFYINNCCLSNKFDESSCFGETLLRAEDKGAVAVIGATNYSYWYEDFYWSVGAKTTSVNPNYSSNALGSYDRFFHTHSESFGQWYTTAGQMIQAGNLAVEQSNSDRTEYYWEVYTLMGDPSLVPYAGIPQDITATIPDNLPIGEGNKTFQSLPAYTNEALSIDTTLIAAAQADQMGNLDLEFEPISTPDSLTITMTNQFYKPFTVTIPVIVADEPYISLSEFRFEDIETGEQVEKLQPNKTYNVHFNAKNIGNRPLSGAEIRIEWLEHVSVVGSYDYQVGNFAVDQTIECDSVFQIQTHPTIEDGFRLDFVFIVEGVEYNRSQVVKKFVEAPKLDIDKINIETAQETTQIEVTVKNIGSIGVGEGVVSIESRSANLLFPQSTSVNVDALNPNASQNVSFPATISSEEDIVFVVTYTAVSYSSRLEYVLEFTIPTVDFDQAVVPEEWINDANNAWRIDTERTNGGEYALRSGSIGNGESSVLTINTTVLSSDSVSFYVSVSSENNYDFFKFYIDGVEKTSLSGTSNSGFVRRAYALSAGEHTLRFEYIKDNSQSSGSDAAWIDDLTLPRKGVWTGLSQIATNDLRLAPNPADKYIGVSGIEFGSRVFIFDNNGKKLYEGLSISSDLQIDVSNLPSGIYNLCVEKDNRLITKKVIIAR